MVYIYAFLFAGIVSAIGQIILDNTKLSTGHITSIFVVLGAFLDTFSIYDFFIKYCGTGAMIPITSFGHSLIHGALEEVEKTGMMGLFTGMFNITASGITAAIVFSFVLAIIFNPKN